MPLQRRDALPRLGVPHAHALVTEKAEAPVELDEDDEENDDDEKEEEKEEEEDRRGRRRTRRLRAATLIQNSLHWVEQEED